MHTENNFKTSGIKVTLRTSPWNRPCDPFWFHFIKTTLSDFYYIEFLFYFISFRCFSDNCTFFLLWKLMLALDVWWTIIDQFTRSIDWINILQFIFYQDKSLYISELQFSFYNFFHKHKNALKTKNIKKKS